MATGREKFKRNKRLLEFLAKIFKLFPKSVLLYMWNCTANHSQILFVGIRYIILKALVRSCGDNVKIGANVQIMGWHKLSIGTNVSIHCNCYIDAHGEIKIGDNVSIAHNSTILSTNHDWSNPTLPIKYNSMIPIRVVVENDVWIGCGCRILAGIKIGERAVVAAGA